MEPGLPTVRTWRPWPLHWHFLVAFIIISVFLCVAIELILYGCSAVGAGDGCHVFGALSTTEFSHWSGFAYNQLPTVISLALNMLWAIPHHDVLRLEPYFRMSAPEGATAAESIFLEYPYVFGPFLLYEAGKRRHYVVMLSSCVTVLISFLITPLITGMFDDRILERLVPGNATRRMFLPRSGGNRTLSADFTYVAYDHTWVGGALPQFTTPEYAVLPVVNDTRVDAGGESWTAASTLFEAELTCEIAANIDASYAQDTGVRMNITSKTGGYTVHLCDQSIQRTTRIKALLSLPTYHCDAYTTFITPWTSIATRLNSYDNETHGWKNASAVYMYAWASGPDPSWESTPGVFPLPTNITALFCMTSYYSQMVTANFTMPDGRVDHVDRIGDRTPFVDIANLEEVIDGQWDAVSIQTENSTLGLGHLPSQVPNVDSQLRRRLGPRPANLTKYFGPDREDVIDASSHSVVYMGNVYALSGFALSDRTPENLAELLDPNILAAAHKNALQTLFAIAIIMELVDLDGDSTVVVPVMRRVWSRGFQVNSLWARGSQGGLIAVILMVAVLALMIGRRPCNLDGEPNSLAEALRLLAASPEMSSEMENAEFHAPEELLKVFNEGDRRYKLDLVPDKGPRVQTVGVREHARLPAATEENQKPWMEKVWPLRWRFGAGFLLCFGMVTVLLTLSFSYSYMLHGLPMLAPINSFEYKILFSYIPIGLGVAMEPVIVAIATCQCMLTPYLALKQGPVSSSKSLAVDYDQSPPHFQPFRSLRTVSLPLAAVTFAILLCNVLAVAMAGLFSATTAEYRTTTEVHTYATPKIYGQFTEPAQEMYFLLHEHLQIDIPVPTWTTPEYYVLPVLPVNPNNVVEYQTPTLGIGVDIKCGLVPAKNITLICDSSKTGKTTVCPVADWALYENFVVVDDPCWGSIQATIANPVRKFTLEFEWHHKSYNTIVRSANCSNTFFPTWLEWPEDLHIQNGSTQQDSANAVILKCRSADRVVELIATVDAAEQVSTSRVWPLNAQRMAALYPGNATSILAPTFIEAIRAGIRTESSNDGQRIRWLSHLMAAIEPRVVRNITGLSDLPDAAYVARGFESVYRWVFAINLRLYADTIVSLREPQSHTVSVSALVQTNRVTVSSLMFYISVAILITLIVMLVLLYWGPRQPVGHLPKHLAGMYALLYASNAKEDCGKLSGRDPVERAHNLEMLGGKYAYGPFDGGKHHGVYKVETIE